MILPVQSTRVVRSTTPVVLRASRVIFGPRIDHFTTPQWHDVFLSGECIVAVTHRYNASQHLADETNITVSELHMAAPATLQRRSSLQFVSTGSYCDSRLATLQAVHATLVHAGRRSHTLTIARIQPAAATTAAKCPAVMTLFKDTTDQIVPWVQYHSKLGFCQFYLYFNGWAGELEAAEHYGALADLASSGLLTMIEWPMPYLVNPALGMSHGNQLSQSVAMHDAYMRYAAFHPHLFFFDTDEYMYAVKGSWASLVAAHSTAPCMRLASIPAVILRGDESSGQHATVASVADLLSQRVLATGAPQPRRGKYWVRTSSQQDPALWIHVPFQPSCPYADNATGIDPAKGGFLHILNLGDHVSISTADVLRSSTATNGFLDLDEVLLRTFEAAGAE